MNEEHNAYREAAIARKRIVAALAIVARRGNHEEIAKALLGETSAFDEFKARFLTEVAVNDARGNHGADV